MAKQTAAKSEKKEVERLRGVASEVLDFLEDEAKSIRDAETILRMLGVEIDRMFNQKRMNTTVNDLGVKIDVDDKDEKRRYNKLLSILEEETVTNSIGLLDGVLSAIEYETNKYKMTIPLDTLDIDMFPKEKEDEKKTT